MGDYYCYDILSNSTYGRYAVASKDLEPGDLIISECPYTYGPKSDSTPVCLGCHSGVDGKTTCSVCGWPVCNEICEKLPIHSNNECVVFSNAKIKFRSVEDLTQSCPQYECITPLRVLLTKERDEEKWSREIQPLESHREKREKTDMWRVESVNVVGFLHKVCKLQQRFSAELIHFVCGILEVNAFVAPALFGFEVRCLYPRSSLLTHSCVPNVGHYISLKSGCHKIHVRAMVKIPKGQELLLTYTQTLSPTLFRRAQLREGKYFECTCRRCADPSELGTNLSTLKCTNCRNGDVLSTNPLDETAPWKCNSCSFECETKKVMEILHKIQNEADALKSTPNNPVTSREAFIDKHQSILHPSHAIIMTVKSTLSQLYGRANGYLLKDLPDELLDRKINLCYEISAISDKIKPGISRQRGWNLYELYSPLLLQAKRFQVSEGHEQYSRDKLEEAIKYLEEVAVIFFYEDPESPEGIAGQYASQVLKELKASVANL